jgi:hypothetical protein
MSARRVRGFALFVMATLCACVIATVVHAASPKMNGIELTASQLREIAAARGGMAGAGVVEEARQGRALSSARVLPPQSMPYGLSYGDWSVRWWQWAYGLPVAGHPLFDESGADCAAGQSGPVWFLGGVFNVSGTATRDECTVPAGKALFFPIINVEWDNICPPVDPPLTEAELAATAASWMDLATDLVCELDGRPVQNLSAYRFTAGPFSVHMPTGNIWDFFGCDAPAGTYAPLLPDGIFVMLAPLSAGPHTLHFKGTIGAPVNFTLEITYHLTVAPGAQQVNAEIAAGSAADPADAPPVQRTSWGRVKAISR